MKKESKHFRLSKKEYKVEDILFDSFFFKSTFFFICVVWFHFSIFYNKPVRNGGNENEYR